jgi:16S rRNA (cytosine967-C5)-methyltransferase
MAALARRLNCDNLVPVGGDSESLPFRSSFSRILLDAPCSSLGTLARNPDVKWRLQEADLGEHASRQYRLLESCASLLAPEGRLVYATCSTEPEENEEVIKKFLHRHDEFHIAPVPESFPEGARRLIGERGELRTLPERDQMDGYYAVALSRKAIV